ncbi:MAG: PEP/pyruvate-binding domain-containing protein [Candidatus Paceibacterota bacterium]|jgi:phosphohistidine swiveling domain-containing protein
MGFIQGFNQIGKGDAAIAGGKGASLGEMTQAGIPVPPGFVILSNAFEHFLEETGLNAEIDTILHSVDQREMHTVENASEKIQALILNAQMPEDIAATVRNFYTQLDTQFVAVRSSATAEDSASAAWAGQLDSFLNTTEETLLTNVQKCWASLFTPRAIFYRFEKELHKQKISVAVVVQKMVQSEVSGIAFSVHPVTEDYNQLIIEAGFGLGEAIVSGSVTPDSYVIEKEPRHILDKNVTYQSRALWRAENGGNEWRELSQEEGTKPALSDEQALELAKIILLIESHYGFPCDIEWAYEAGTFYITQSRPITTLAPPTSPLSTGINPGDYRFYGLWKCNLLADWYWTQWLVPEYASQIGLYLKDGGIFVINGGNFFVKKEVIEIIRTYARGIIENQDREKLLKLRALANDVHATVIAETKRICAGNPTAGSVRAVAEAGRHIMFAWSFGYLLSEVLDEFLIPAATAAGVKAEDISALIPPFQTPLSEAQDSLRNLKKVLEEKGYWNTLLQDSTVALTEIKKDSEMCTMIEAHTKQHGWTTMMNLVGEDPSIEEIVDQITNLTQKNEHRELASGHNSKLSFLIDFAASTAYLRQTGVEYFSIYSRDAKNLFKQAARKLNITYRELLDLNLDEITNGLDGSSVKEIISRRVGDTWAIYTVPGNEPRVIDDLEIIRQLVSVMIPKAEESEDGIISGQIGNKGIAQGRVKIILSQEDFSKMGKGDVLVATMTNPDFVPLMQKAAAIVTNIGGLLCHAAIISREMNIPCVIGTKFATQVLHDGDLVEVDADNGVVRILEKSTQHA